ncbi:hypothetical protein ACOMHN_045828 [Nucella lapillus]
MCVKKTLTALCILGLWCVLTPGGHGNQYDPHLYPSTGPFFEGWYMRLLDRAQRVSIEFLFGRVLPADCSLWANPPPRDAVASHGCSSAGPPHTETRKGEHPVVLAAILLQGSNVSQQLRPIEGSFPLKDYSVTVKGGPVIRNPDDRSPPDFAIRFCHNGSVVVKDGHTFVEVKVGSVMLTLWAEDPLPWGPGGEGPEGWLQHLPLPLHWFVYSLRSRVRAYRLVDRETGRATAGQGARLYMEKNWGLVFPAGWVWSQALTDSNVSWALAGGIVDFRLFNVTAFLAGYRNPAKNLTINFTPAKSWVTFTYDGCQGNVSMTLRSWRYRVTVVTDSPPASFSQCLLGPGKDGFRPACVETYEAVVSIQVVLDLAALELGGLYVCKQKRSRV